MKSWEVQHLGYLLVPVRAQLRTQSRNTATELESKLPTYIAFYLRFYFKRMLRIFIHTYKGKNKEGKVEREGGEEEEEKETDLPGNREGGGRRRCR